MARGVIKRIGKALTADVLKGILKEEFDKIHQRIDGLERIAREIKTANDEEHRELRQDIRQLYQLLTQMQQLLTQILQVLVQQQIKKATG
jgi:flagellar capping protein FliD